MTEVGIADFKAHLSRYLRQARSGDAVTVTDRGTRVARLVPVPADGLQERAVRSRLRRLPLPPPSRLTFDIAASLLEERQRGR